MQHSWFQKQFQTLIHLTSERFSILPRLILSELWSWEDSSVSRSCSYVATFHDRALTCVCWGVCELCSHTVISGSVPEPMHRFPSQNHAWFYCSIWRSWASNTDFLPCPLCTVISLDSLEFFKQYYVWNCFSVFRQFFEHWWNSANFYFCCWCHQI